MVEIRSMGEGDLEAVAEVTDLAFIEVIARLSGRTLERPFFAISGLALRLAGDPEGCLVAVDDDGIAGALFSVARGTLAWFGPLAVDSRRQGAGLGQALVAECLRRWSGRGVRLQGLETFPNSSFHLHLYSKFGFQPAWTGVELRKRLDGEAGHRDAEPAPPLQHPAVPLPDLGYLYPGFDAAGEVRAVLERRAGRVFATDRSLAIVLLDGAFHVSAENAFIPLLVAPDRAGKQRIALRMPGACWGAFQALVENGYRAGQSALRMKTGENLDYDRDAWYCDDWL